MIKHFIALVAVVCCALTVNATTYNSHIKVVVNDIVSEQDMVQVEVTQADGLYNLSLKNFSLTSDGITLPVGNIVVTGVEGVDEYGYTTILFKSPIVITPGDDPNYQESDWIGPLLGEVPIDLAARFTDTALNAQIDIEMAMLGQVISVSLFGVSPAQSGLDGDVNKDGEVNIADINSVIDIILSH
jgi:hypothetical protein